MSEAPTLKEWPNDALIIVAASPEDACFPLGVTPMRRTCRDCGTALSTCPSTYRRAMSDPDRRERPIAYLCVDCVAQYDRATLDKFVDCRPNSQHRRATHHE